MAGKLTQNGNSLETAPLFARNNWVGTSALRNLAYNEQIRGDGANLPKTCVIPDYCKDALAAVAAAVWL